MSAKILSTNSLIGKSSGAFVDTVTKFLLNLPYSSLACSTARSTFAFLEVKKYVPKFKDPLCCTNLVPYGTVFPKSLRLLVPGNAPLKVSKLSTILSTWSITSPNVKLLTLSFNGLFCKFIGNS